MSLFVWTVACVAVFRVKAQTQYRDAHFVEHATIPPYSEVGVLVFKNAHNTKPHHYEMCTGSVVKNGYDTAHRCQFIDVLTAGHCLNKEGTLSYDLKFFQGINEQGTVHDAYAGDGQTQPHPTHTVEISREFPFGFTGLNMNILADDPNDAAIVRFRGESTSGRTLQIGFDDTNIGQKVGYPLNNVVYQFLVMGKNNKVTDKPNPVGLMMMEYKNIQTVKHSDDGLTDGASFCTPGMSGSPLLRPGNGNDIVGVLNGQVSKPEKTCMDKIFGCRVDLWVRFDQPRKHTLDGILARNVGPPPIVSHVAHESMYDELEADKQNEVSLVNALFMMDIGLMLMVLSVCSICCFVGGFVCAFASANWLKMGAPKWVQNEN